MAEAGGVNTWKVSNMQKGKTNKSQRKKMLWVRTEANKGQIRFWFSDVSYTFNITRNRKDREAMPMNPPEQEAVKIHQASSLFCSFPALHKTSNLLCSASFMLNSLLSGRQLSADGNSCSVSKIRGSFSPSSHRCYAIFIQRYMLLWALPGMSSRGTSSLAHS